MFNKPIPDNLFTDNNTADIYNIGHFYNQNVFSDQYYPYYYDGWTIRKGYGIIDTYNNIIYPKQSSLLAHSVNQKNINFVTDAFNDLKLYNNDLIKIGRIKDLSIFTKLVAHKTTDSVPNLYLLYLKNFYDMFIQIYLVDRRKKIYDIQTFMGELVNYLTIVCNLACINRSSYIKSKFVPQSINGLSIALDNVTYNADYRSKANTYISNSQFDHHIASAAKFGFFVDRNFPHMIIADLESPKMKQYAKNRGYFSTEDVFEKAYFKAYEADLDSLKNVVLTFWNSFAYYSKSEVIDDTNIKNQIVHYNQLTMEMFEYYYNINWQLRLYLYLRILEDKINIDQIKFNNLHTECIKIAKYIGTEAALKFINVKLLELQTPLEVTLPHLTTADSVVRMIAAGFKSEFKNTIIF